jgi:hypothetical protein
MAQLGVTERMPSAKATVAAFQDVDSQQSALFRHGVGGGPEERQTHPHKAL